MAYNSPLPAGAGTQVSIPPDGSEFDIFVRVRLDGASPAAKRAFKEFVQEYADELADEVAVQEFTTRVKGARTPEVIETHVRSAREILGPKPDARHRMLTATRHRVLTKMEAALITIYTLLTSAVGVSANHLGSPLGEASFGTTLLGVAVCAYIAWKKKIL